MKTTRPFIGRLKIDARLLLASVGSVPIIFVAGLVLVVLWISFQVITPSGSSNIGLQAYRELYGDPFVYRTLLNTALFSLVTVAIALFFGVVAAWLVERTDLPYMNVLFTFMATGILVPGFITAMGWVFLLHPRIGLINIAITSIPGMEWASINIATPIGMGFIQGLGLTPLAFIMVAATFRSLNPALEEAASVHGMGLFPTLLHVTLPLAFPGILAAGIYISTIGIAAFDVPAVVGLPNRVLTFSTFLYFRVQPEQGSPRYDLAGAFSTLMIFLSLLLSWLYIQVVRHSHRYAVITGKAYQPKLVELGRWTWLAWVFLGFYLILGQILPVLVLLWNSILPYFQPISWSSLGIVSFQNYRNLPWSYLMESARNTGILMVCVASLTLAFSLAISWTVTRSELAGRFVLDAGAFLPHVIPHVILAVGANYVGLFVLGKVLPIYGTIYILLALYVLAWLSFGTRVLNTAILQVHKELEEVGKVSGISLLTCLRKILVPLIAPAMANAWLWMALLSYRELTMASLLVTPHNLTFPVFVWSLWMEGSITKAAAASVLGLAFMIPLVALYWFFGRRTSWSEALI